MRLDRVKVEVFLPSLRQALDQAMANPGRTSWVALKTSPKDGVQVGFKLLGAKIQLLVVYLRRPGGPEHLQEMEALLQALGLSAITIIPAKGNGVVKRPWGPPSFLVAFVPVNWHPLPQPLF